VDWNQREEGMVGCPNLVRNFPRASMPDLVGSTKPVTTSRPLLGFLANQVSNSRAITSRPLLGFLANK
jgi:hypothetical protein